ncbi:MAG: hypothetical protein MUE52_18735 [Tabrizicola sp.]|nr:hypothetical protein [Tabrizicola sp.]
MLRATALALCLASSAQGQDLSPEAFQDLTEGRVFATYYADGTLQGHEVFLRDRKVIWQATGSICEDGIWQVQDGYICYLYGGVDPGYCLTYRAEGDVIVGNSDTGETFILQEASKDDMTCPVEEPLLSRADIGVTLR